MANEELLPEGEMSSGDGAQLKKDIARMDKFNKVASKKGVNNVPLKLRKYAPVSGDLSDPKTMAAYQAGEYMAGAGRGKQGGPTAKEVQGYKVGGTVASKRADGIAQRGKTRGQMR